LAENESLVRMLKIAGYSEKAIDYYLKKVNVGVIEEVSPESFTGLCGDSMQIFLKVENGVIKDAKFQAIGCAGAFASGSAVTEMVKGKTLEEAEKITEEDVVNALGSLPKPKFHCARLAVDALKKSLEKYRQVRN